MFQQAGTAQLNDYFRPLSERGGSRVFFCRIAGYGETVAAFLRRYYEAARRSGVIIDGRIPNPTPDNLSYFNEMMGSGFQMDRDFLSQRLKKWLPRMTDGQRDAVVTAMYATLDDMRRAGKNDNMLRNAYMKYMCWLYYKFERIVNVLGGETLPKILYAGDVSHYELQLLTVLSRAGADIVLLECGGDQAYLTVDPQSALSHLYQAPGLGSFPAGFGVKQPQAELERAERQLNMALGRQKAVGDPAALAAEEESLSRELERREGEYQAISAALEGLKAANAQLQERFSPELNRWAADYLSRLTGGRYRELSLDRELDASATEGSGVLPRRALFLSKGTVDQIYLAVRLAVYDLCLKERRAPLVLDDALAAFDDGRMALALDLLAQLAEDRQILLFTCQSREAACLSGRPEVTIQSLPARA